MKVYLAGPMRGKEDHNFPAFHFAAAKPREQGYEVFSPARRARKRGLSRTLVCSMIFRFDGWYSG